MSTLANHRSVSAVRTLVAALALLATARAPAAEFPSSNPPSAATELTNSPTRLPPVLVTAQKEPAELESLPVSVTAVTRSTIEDANIQQVKDASVYAPNTFINEFTARALSNPFFRGIGGSPANPGVTTFIDGVPQLNSYSSSIELIDVDQVEFVRGPQGALFGRNTAGGLVNIVSRRPSDVWTAGAEGGFGNYNLRDFRGAASGPLVENELAVSLAGGYSARDGYTRNDFNGRDVDSREGEFGKGQLLFKPNDRLELRLLISGEHDHDGDYALGDLNYIRAHPNHVSRDFTAGFNHRDVIAPTLLATYYGEAADVTSISGGVWWRNEGLTDLDYGVASPANFFLNATRDDVEEQHQFTQELRFSSPREKPIELGSMSLSWQSGVFFFTQSYEQSAANTFAPPLAFESGRSSADLDDLGAGVYGQIKLTLWERLDAFAGLRFDYEDKDAKLGSSAAAPASLHDNFSEVSPQFGLAWRFASNHTAYASAARGYKAGGFNPPPAGIPAPASMQEYGAEHTWNYEVGYKSKWFDGRLEATASLFYIDWRGLQLNQQIPLSGGQYFIGNAGAAASKGVEFELLYRPLRGWDLFGSVGYAEAKFLSGSTAFNPNLSPPSGSNQNVGGNRLPFTPGVTGNLGTEVFWSPRRPLTLYIRAEAIVCGEFLYDASNAQGQPTYALANFRAGVRGNHWFAEGWIRNAFDSHYVPIAIPYGQLGAPSGYVGEAGAPVTFGMRAGLVF